MKVSGVHRMGGSCGNGRNNSFRNDRQMKFVQFRVTQELAHRTRVVQKVDPTANSIAVINVYKRVLFF